MSRLRRVALLLWLLLAVAGPLLAPLSFRAQDRAATLAPPTWSQPAAAGERHWLGTDSFGRDVFSRLLLASGLSSLLALAMAVPALALATGVGLGAALSPTANALGRAAGEICRSLPWMFALVAVRAAMPLDAGPLAMALALVVLFAAAAWPVAAWSLYGAARNLVQQDFVQAAVGLGATRGQILVRHLWPNLRGLVATYFALLLAAAIGAEVSLELVGLGLPQPWPTWGNMLGPLRDFTVATRCWWLYAPLLVVVPILLGLSLAAPDRAPAPW
ncbi:MAG TPA: ABC transporter permease subunit [Terriglobales bacterium]|nr:ABC transporter permease subunit [Terriglobales bacterium]